MSNQPNPILQSTMPGVAFGDWENPAAGAPPGLSPIFAQGLILDDGTQVPSDMFPELTGNAQDDQSAIGAGTGALLTVAQKQVVPITAVGGSLQLDLGIYAESWFFFVSTLTSDLSLTVVNANLGDSFAVFFTSGGHALNPPPGNSWEQNTAPTWSGAEDIAAWAVRAVTTGVPTRLLGRYSLGYP